MNVLNKKIEKGIEPWLIEARRLTKLEEMMKILGNKIKSQEDLSIKLKDVIEHFNKMSKGFDSRLLKVEGETTLTKNNLGELREEVRDISQNIKNFIASQRAKELRLKRDISRIEDNLNLNLRELNTRIDSLTDELTGWKSMYSKRLGKLIKKVSK